MTSSTELQRLFKKYDITSRKHEGIRGDEIYNWGVFHKGQPVVSCLTKQQVVYYKKHVLEKLMRKEKLK